MTMHPDESARRHILRRQEQEWSEHRHGMRIEARSASLASRLTAKKLGYRLVELAPTKAALPKHFHYANEEMFYILQGEGTLYLGEHELPVAEGDCISIPAGDASLAHQIVNTSSATLRYLAVSTMNEPDVVAYPDSGKVAVYAGAAPGGKKEERTLEYVTLWNHQINYWLNEN